jgi:hypothetical protein
MGGLPSHKIDARCFRILPYTHGDELFVDLQQIIPTPEAAQFMIGMATKEIEEKTVKAVQAPRHSLRREFWTQALEQFRAAGLSRYATISPSQDHWLNSGTGMSGTTFTLIFSKSEARVEVGITRGERDENKWIFDRLHEKRSEFEARFGASLEWLRLDEKKASRIVCSQPFEGYDRENWPAMTGWMIDHMKRLQDTFTEPLAVLNRQMKADGIVVIDD